MADERVIPGETNVINVSKHVARYNVALQYCEQKRVLDAACGSGYGSRLLGMVAKDITGWDINKETIEYAQQRYSDKNIAYYQVDLEKLNTYDLRTIGGANEFDTVVCFETLEHLSDPTVFLNRAATLMSKDGILVASVPLNETVSFNEHHKHVYTLETAKSLFSGFNHIFSVVQHGLSFYPSQPEFSRNPYTYILFIGKVR